MPIALSSEEWARITRWTDTSREDAEVAQKQEYIRFLDETSKEMTKSWPNSLENVNKRNEELRRARIEAAEQANAIFYKKYIKRKKEEQERLMYGARDTVFKNKDAPKMLLSAVIETVTQKERQEQLKFINELRRQAAEQKRRDDDDIIQKAKEWNELMALRKQRRFEANKKYQKEILDQAHEVAERKRQEYENELNMQKVDNIKADEQMEELKKFEEKFKAEEKARIWSDMERSRAEVASRNAERAARERMDERLLEVLQKTSDRVDAKRRQTEREIQEEKLRVLEKISQKLETGDASRDAREQEILNKAVKEKNDLEEYKRQALEKKQAKLKQERLNLRKQFLAEEEQRLHEMQTMRQWELMNRFKNKEVYEAFLERQRKEKERKTKEHREDLLRLWKERDEREAREKAETRHFYGELAEQKLREADNRLLVHGAVLIEEAKRHSRPDFALRRALDRYCKQYRLYAMPELPAPLRAHFPAYAPRDSSRPDPHYRPPSPPPSRRDGVTNGNEGNQRQNGGMKKEVDSVQEDYKKRGPANGLQRKSSEVEVKLPPIKSAEMSAGGK